MPTGYTSVIMEATGCSPVEADRIEDVMRNDIFNSTLDWQSREELEEAARLALAILQHMDHDSAAEHVSSGRAAGRRDCRVEVMFRLTQSQCIALGATLWTITESVPGLRSCRIEWVLPSNYYLTLAGSRRAVTRAARMAGLAQDEIRQAVRECLTPGA